MKGNKKVFIDCGANQGQSIAAFAKHFPDHSEYEIHSFEPLETFSEAIQQTANKYTFANFYLHKKAVGVQDEETVFYLSNSKYGSSLEADKSNVNINKYTTVECIDLARWTRDNFTLENDIILKIDIEGTEFRLLKHLFLTDTIQYYKEIYVELHGEDKIKINKELREEIEVLISQCTNCKIHTDKSKGLNFL